MDNSNIIFEIILADALDRVCREHGKSYRNGGARAWARAGNAYLSFALLHSGSAHVRQCQYSARNLTGSVILDCSWYDELAAFCFGGDSQACVMLQNEDGIQVPVALDREMFLEMLDFLREG